jgi:hypothetical protein
MNTVEKLNLIRPRFVYLSLRVQKIPVPIFLFAPLVALEFFLMMGAWFIRRSGSRDQQLELALKALEALRGQTWELRKLPPFALVEVEIKSKVFDPNAPARVYLKVGLW